MIHHIPFPIKFFQEMNRILKKDGKLIIFESYCSVVFQLATIIMKHEGFDFTLDVWDEKIQKVMKKMRGMEILRSPILFFMIKKILKKKLENILK